MEQRLCKQCSTQIKGRADKRFCSDYCRNAFNNEQNRVHNKLIRNVNNTLKRNWRILEKLNPNTKCTVHKNKLEEHSFNFNYFTSIYTTKKGTIYYFVYNQGYLALENNYYMLVKRD